MTDNSDDTPDILGDRVDIRISSGVLTATVTDVTDTYERPDDAARLGGGLEGDKDAQGVYYVDHYHEDETEANAEDGDGDGDGDVLSVTEAVNALDDATGQSYVVNDAAMELLEPFASHVTDEFAIEHNDTKETGDSLGKIDRAWALSLALADKQRSASDARGLTNLWPHEQLVTISGVSAILVAALGGEPSEASMLGAGSTADKRHKRNVEKLSELAGESPGEGEQ